MGEQVFGGGVVVLVAVLLWLVYLLPNWYSRHQFNAAERNAVRLGQALRVLAETSETPDEVRLELSARTAHAQQRLARRATAEREHAELETARVDLERARAERAAARALPAARLARSRRRARLVTTAIGAAGLALAGWGIWQLTQTGVQIALWSGLAVAGIAGLMLRRMAHVGARSGSVLPAGAARAARPAQDLQEHLVDDRSWTPRSLPQPLGSAAGSRAAAVLDTAEAQQALRDAARVEELRRRAEELRPAPPDIAAARAARIDGDVAAMGYVDDAEIEAHVRQLLARRAAG